MNDMTITRRAALAGLGAAALPVPAIAAREAITARIVVEDRRLWLAASIDGSEPMLFIVDTGAAGNFIRPDVAKRLKLDAVGAGMVGGVGGREALTQRVEARNVVIGAAVRQPRMVFSTYDLGRGGDAAGLFAAGLLTAFDSDLDFVNGVWRVWTKGREGSPAGQRLAGSSITAMGGRAASERIYVDAVLDGQRYRLLVDTGAPASLLLLPRAAARSGLFAGRPFAPQRTRGFGGAAPKLSRLVRADRLELGPLALKRPFVTVMDPDQAITMGGTIDGLLGLPLITLFDLATEVGPGKIWLGRNTRPATADPYSRAGLWLDQTPGGGARVTAVGMGSPAAAAGIVAGDAIASPATFDAAMLLMRGDAGAEIDLKLDRAGTKVDARMTLRDYL